MEKTKVNVAEIMQRAKEKTATVKESTVKAQSKIDNFRMVPCFSKFEFNGNILRNSKTKTILKFKTGRIKYQIFDDKGFSHNLSNEDLRLLLPNSEKVKPVKEPKVKKEKIIKEKKQKICKVEIQPDLTSEKEKVADISKKEIISGDHKNHKKHYMLYLKGMSALEIQDATKSPLPSIKRDIWRYMNGKTVL